MARIPSRAGAREGGPVPSQDQDQRRGPVQQAPDRQHHGVSTTEILKTAGSVAITLGLLVLVLCLVALVSFLVAS